MPDSATTVAFNISRNWKVDHNNRKGFVLPLYNSKGEMLPGSKASQAYFYTSYDNMYEVKNDSALTLIEEDLKKNPEILPEWELVYARLLYAENKERAKKHIEERITKRGGKENIQEEDLMAVYGLLELVKDQKAADSLKEMIIEQYPKSPLKKQKYLQELQKAEKTAEKEKIFEKFNTEYGPEESGFEKNYMLELLLRDLAKEESWGKFEYYSKLMTDEDRQASMYNSIAWRMAQKDQNLGKAAELSNLSLELVKLGKKPDYLTKNQFENTREYSERMYQDTYAYILMKQGKIEEAIDYQKKAVGEGLYSEFNERYVKLLLEGGEPEKALNEAAKFIKNNKATFDTKEAYKAAYIEIEGSEKGLKDKLTKLEEAAKRRAEIDIKKEMMNEEAPAFTLKDLDGNEVSLASLKGKTVILDFWATWCAPCIESFPGMEAAVKNYKNDSKVAFFFVNTFENIPSREKEVADFITENNYPFHVLLDLRLDDFNTFKTAQDYGISGIPTKVIIGPDGNTKFKNMGYSGNNEQMLQELEIMISLIEKEVSEKKINS